VNLPLSAQRSARAAVGAAVGAALAARAPTEQSPTPFSADCQTILICTLLGVAIGTSSCTNRVQIPKAALPSKIEKSSPLAQSISSKQSAIFEAVAPCDAQAEAAVSEGCVSAWRKALAGDEEGAMAQLHDLDKKYPGLQTTRFMMGQVSERVGKKGESLQYYREAAKGADFNTIHIFKFAEALRTTGDAKGAIVEYRRLLSLLPDFPEGKLGLAKSLLAIDKKSKEARQKVEEVLAQDPHNSDAKALLAKIGDSK
jgi:tetratricopeptide (TPR) repeat protein